MVLFLLTVLVKLNLTLFATIVLMPIHDNPSTVIGNTEVLPLVTVPFILISILIFIAIAALAIKNTNARLLAIFSIGIVLLMSLITLVLPNEYYVGFYLMKKFYVFIPLLAMAFLIYKDKTLKQYLMSHANQS